MDRALGLLLSSVALCGGLCGVIWPDLYRSSFEEQYTPRRARISCAVLLLLGLACLVSILSDKGGPADFFPCAVPEQFIALERIHMEAEVCGEKGKATCTFIQNGASPVLNVR